MFADALRAQLTSSDHDRVAHLHRAASDWHTSQGRLPDAIGHALAAGDTALAADLLELALADLRRRRENRALRDWLVALPEELVRRRPLLAACVGWTRLTVGDLDGVTAWLDAAEAALRSPAPSTIATAVVPRSAVADRDSELTSLPAMIEVYRASVAQARGDTEGTVLHAARAREMSGPQDHFARSGAAGFLGLAAWAAGDLDTAVSTFSEALASMQAAGMVADELGATVVMASMWLVRGKPVEARHCYERALAAVAAHPDQALPVLGDLHVGLADVLREQGELDDAAQHLQTARDLGEYTSLLENRFRWHACMGGLLRARGELDGAVAMLEQAQRLYLPGFFPDTRPIPAQIARVRIAQGRVADGWAWARAHSVHAGQEPTYLAEFALLTLARLLLAQHQVDHDPAHLDIAAQLLDRLVAAAESARRGGSIVEARLIRALTRQARGDRDAALSDLVSALAAGVPAGYVRLYLDEGRAMERLLEAAAGHGPAGADHAAELLRVARDARRQPEQASADAGAAVPGAEQGLSDREREVLRLLATELTGPQIAAHLFVSVNTLRSHTKHIFGKLDVNTRRAAVGRGAELGLL